MEPRQDESQKEPEPRKELKERKRRFQIVKLEERIAPGRNNSRGNCYPGYTHPPKGWCR